MGLKSLISLYIFFFDALGILFNSRNCSNFFKTIIGFLAWNLPCLSFFQAFLVPRVFLSNFSIFGMFSQLLKTIIWMQKAALKKNINITESNLAILNRSLKWVSPNPSFNLYRNGLLTYNFILSNYISATFNLYKCNL